MANVYNRAKYKLLDGTADLDAGTPELRCLLLKSGVSFDVDHNVVNDLVPGTNEISVSGYARQTLSGVALTENDTNDRGEAEANQVTFSSLAAGQTIGAAVVYKRASAGSDTDASDWLIGYYDVTDTPTNGGDVVIQFDSASPGDFLRIT